MHIHCPAIPILPARAANQFLQSSFPKIVSRLTRSLYFLHPVAGVLAWSQPCISRNWILIFSPHCLNWKSHPADQGIPPQESRKTEQLTWLGSQARIPMTHARDHNPKCLLCPLSKSPTPIFRKIKETQLGRATWKVQRFIAMPLWQEAGKSKNKRGREGDRQTRHNILGSTPWQRKHQNLAITPKQKVAVGLHCTKFGLWHERTQPLSTNQFSALGLFWPTQKYSLSFTFAQLDFIYYIFDAYVPPQPCCPCQTHGF